MKSSVEELSALERQLNIEVPVEKISDSFTRIFKNIQRDAQIKGFRKGKAPLTVIRKMYGDRVQQDVLQDIVHQGFYECIQEHDLQPINQPIFNFENLHPDKSFTFTAKFEVRPDIELKKYEGLPVEKEKLELKDERVEQVINDVLERKAENVDVFEDRPAAEGDIAVVDFEGFVDGAPLENGKADGHELELGSNTFIDGFEEGLYGMKAGDERTLNLSFPETYHVADLAAKPVEFKVRLVGLKKKSLPELTDEFVKELGWGQENVEDFKKSIREDLEKNEVRRIEEDMKNRLLKELVRNNPVEVPPSMLQDQKQSLIADFRNRMRQSGMSDEDFAEYTKKWDADFEASARQMIQSSFLIDAISKKHELNATSEDLNKKMAEMAEQAGMEIDRVKEVFKNDDQLSRLSFQVTEQNVVDFLLNSANVHEVPGEKLRAEEGEES